LTGAFFREAHTVVFSSAAISAVIQFAVSCEASMADISLDREMEAMAESSGVPAAVMPLLLVWSVYQYATLRIGGKFVRWFLRWRQARQLRST
jgi:hypothetical protein